MLDSVSIHPSYKEDLSKSFIPPKLTQGQSRFDFVPPFSCRRCSDLHWFLMFHLILACHLHFSLHETHPTEKASQKTVISLRDLTQEHFFFFDSVSTHPSDEEDLSKTFMSARFTQRQFHCLFPFPLWLPSVFDFRWTLIFR